jgi:hypothetical protein
MSAALPSDFEPASQFIEALTGSHDTRMCIRAVPHSREARQPRYAYDDYFDDFWNMRI